VHPAARHRPPQRRQLLAVDVEAVTVEEGQQGVQRREGKPGARQEYLPLVPPPPRKGLPEVLRPRRQDGAVRRNPRLGTVPSPAQRPRPAPALGVPGPPVPRGCAGAVRGARGAWREAPGGPGCTGTVPPSLARLLLLLLLLLLQLLLLGGVVVVALLAWLLLLLSPFRSRELRPVGRGSWAAWARATACALSKTSLSARCSGAMGGGRISYCLSRRRMRRLRAA